MRATSLLVLLAVGCIVSPAAARQDTSPKAPVQEQIIVYAHTARAEISIAVDGLSVYRSDPHIWDHQFNLTSWLDTEPQRVTINASLGGEEESYCTVEVRKAPAGHLASATLVAQKTVRGSEVVKAARRKAPVLSLEIARPPGSVRPLWADHSQYDLRAVIRERSTDLVQEIFSAFQACDMDALMALIAPAVTNQAQMEGADPELLAHITRARLKQDCIPSIRVPATMDGYYKALGEDVMAPLNFGKMVYDFTVDDSRSDHRGNLYTPTKIIKERTSDWVFEMRPYLSYANEERTRRFVGRLVFERR